MYDFSCSAQRSWVLSIHEGLHCEYQCGSGVAAPRVRHQVLVRIRYNEIFSCNMRKINLNHPVGCHSIFHPGVCAEREKQS